MAGGEIQPGDVLVYTATVDGQWPVSADSIINSLATSVYGAASVAGQKSGPNFVVVNLQSLMERARVSDLKYNLDQVMGTIAPTGFGSDLDFKSKVARTTPATTPSGGGVQPDGQKPPAPPGADVFAELAAKLGITKDQLMWGGAALVIGLLVLKKR